MVTKELLEGVKRLRSAGATPEDIRSALESRGWNNGDIEEVFSLTDARAEASQQEVEQTRTQPKPQTPPEETELSTPKSKPEQKSVAKPTTLSPATERPRAEHAMAQTAPERASAKSERPKEPELRAREKRSEHTAGAVRTPRPTTETKPKPAPARKKTAKDALLGPAVLAHEALVLMKERFWSLIAATFFSFFLVSAALFLIHAGLSSLSVSFFAVPLSEFLAGGAADASRASLITGAPLMFALALVMAILTMWLPASLISALGSLEGGRGKALRHGFVRQGALFFTLLLSIFFASIGAVFFIIPGVLCLVWFGFAPIVSVLERKSGLSALVQSRAYVQGRFWPVVGRQMFLFVPVVLLMVFFLLVAFPLLYFGDTNALAMSESLYLVFALVSLITACIFFCFFVLGYETALYENLKMNTRTPVTSEGLGRTLFVLGLIVVIASVSAMVMIPEAVEGMLNALPWFEDATLPFS